MAVIIRATFSSLLSTPSLSSSSFLLRTIASNAWKIILLFLLIGFNNDNSNHVHGNSIHKIIPWYSSNNNSSHAENAYAIKQKEDDKKIFTMQSLYKMNQTESLGLPRRPPRRNDKAMRLNDARAKNKYSYYYLSRSVLYFILYYMMYYNFYFLAHIVRSAFLHRVRKKVSCHVNAYLFIGIGSNKVCLDFFTFHKKSPLEKTFLLLFFKPQEKKISMFSPFLLQKNVRIPYQAKPFKKKIMTAVKSTLPVKNHITIM